MILVTTGFVLTSTVNFPVSNSARSGSAAGSKRTSPSRIRVASCCSYRVSPRPTSNLRAIKNLTFFFKLIIIIIICNKLTILKILLTAVAHESGPEPLS